MFKYLLFFILLSVSQLTCGQDNKRDSHSVLPPAYFLDGKLLKQLPYFDVDKIESVDVKSGSVLNGSQPTNGKILITTKNPLNFNFLSL